MTQNKSNNVTQKSLTPLPWYIEKVKLIIFAYILFTVIYSTSFLLSQGENFLLPSNEFGDFLAGIFAPLAFYMLAVGYYQNTQAIKLQQHELEQNTKALQLQAQELANSVEQQKALVEATESQLNQITFQHQQNQENFYKQLEEQKLQDKLNAMPVIQFKHIGNLKNYEIINIGSPISNVYLIGRQGVSYMTPYIPVLKTSSDKREETIEIRVVRNSSFCFEVVFTTVQGITFKQIFENQPLSNESQLFEILPLGVPEEQS